MNYDPYVVMKEVSDNQEHYWTPHEEGGWRYMSHAEWITDPQLPRYDVSEREYFHGAGSVITAWHAALGVGAGVIQGAVRDGLKEKYGGIDVAGHIIHALLAYEAHYRWVLYELSLNILTSKSIYIPHYAEQRTGLYHTITEYRAGLEAAEKFNLPGYAKNRIEPCRHMLDILERVSGNAER
jgi:hypothetical protein